LVNVIRARTLALLFFRRSARPFLLSLTFAVVFFPALAANFAVP
jgi:hypothetical protein